MEHAAQGARANGTPWLSFLPPAEILALAEEAGFREVEHVSAGELSARYFMHRTYGLAPPLHAEALLLART